jgi:hypothetical protein
MTVDPARTWERFYHQKARLAWAQLRATALALREARERVTGLDEAPPSLSAEVWAHHLQKAEEDWEEAWSDLDFYRRQRAQTRAFRGRAVPST